jgi:hypothetical protein
LVLLLSETSPYPSYARLHELKSHNDIAALIWPSPKFENFSLRADPVFQVRRHAQTQKRPGETRPFAERCSSLVMGDFEVSRLRAAEVEIAVVQVEVIEADVAEVSAADG